MQGISQLRRFLRDFGVGLAFQQVLAQPPYFIFDYHCLPRESNDLGRRFHVVDTTGNRMITVRVGTRRRVNRYIGENPIGTVRPRVEVRLLQRESRHSKGCEIHGSIEVPQFATSSCVNLTNRFSF